MSLQVLKESGNLYHPVFLGLFEDIQGGVTVKTDRFPTTTKEIKKGALLNAMTGVSIGLYDVIKTVRLTADAASADTVLAVEPADHLFKVGECIYLAGGTASTITRVSSTEIAFETAIAETVSAPASGAVLFETDAAPATAVKFAADAILKDTVEVRSGGVATLLDNLFAGAVVRGTCDESQLPYFVTDADKTNLTARIRFA